MSNVERIPDKDSLFTKCQRPFRRAGEWIEVRETYCPLVGKLSVNADEPQVAQWHEGVERILRKEVSI